MFVEPIGFFRGEQTFRQELPRQGVFAGAKAGRVELLPGKNFETALRDLEGFDRIWLLFQFHQNKDWRPTTSPPVSSPKKNRIGLFASRAPYRPNPIGLSAVKLIRIDSLFLFVEESDLLDGSPILDIKPYIPSVDSFPNARAGWKDFQKDAAWNVQFSEEAKRENFFLQFLGAPNLEALAQTQLSYTPLNSSKKRVRISGELGILSFRVFRIVFEFNSFDKSIFVKHLFSGYSKKDLTDEIDIYGDKEIHRKFVEQFPNNIAEQLPF